MLFRNLVITSRSYRKFDQQVPLDQAILLKWIDTARFCPSSVNLQPIKYVYCCSERMCDAVFPLITWGRQLKGYHPPPEGRRPTAYIAICIDLTIALQVHRFDVDVGAAAQTILLAAAEDGFGGCMFNEIDMQELRAALQLPAHLHPSLVLALGKPKEKMVLHELKPGEQAGYYLVGEEVHVPKRPLTEVAIPAGKA